MKDDLIEELRLSHRRLLKALSLAPDTGKILGNWTKKEVMAHIAGWYEEFDREIGGVAKILQGEKPVSFRFSIDGYNKRSVEERKNMSESQILKETKDSHKKFLEVLEKMDEQQIIGYYGTLLQGKPINVLWIINESIEHDNNHAKELEEKFG